MKQILENNSINKNEINYLVTSKHFKSFYSGFSYG
jgi:hypothetical protein